MSKQEKKKRLEAIIWINLIIGIYNLSAFINIDSNFHLILGSLNIGVWAFSRDKLTKLNIRWTNTKKVEHRRK